MTRFWSAVIFLLYPLVIGQTGAQAQSCATGAGRLSSKDAAASAQTAQLQRQLAAVRAIERKRQCGDEQSLGGFFNACRDLAGQRKKVEAELAALGGKVFSRGSDSCSASARQQRKSISSAQASSKFAGTFRTGRAVLYCVRLTDGYLFPAPNSQFVASDAADAILRQCQYICENPAMDVYVLEDANLGTEQMISIRNQNSYQDFPRAFRYRSQENFLKCDWSRYVGRVYELQMSEELSKEMADVSVPLPAFRPDVEENDISVEETGSIEKAGPLIDRPVRIVGPVFLQPQ